MWTGLRSLIEQTDMNETSTDYKNPYRPLPVAMVNRIGRFLSLLGLEADLSADGLMRTAVKRTGLDNFGDDQIPLRLKVLSDSLESEARLHYLGRFMSRETILGMLTNRLRMEEDFRRHPEIEDIEIEDPVFIAGLQRTGTTMLQRMIAGDENRFRYLASWEAINPAPLPGGPPDNGKDPRVAQAETAAKALKYLAPDFFAVHPIHAELPEEDCILMNYALLSVVPEATQRVPSFSAWLDEQNQVEAYRFHKRVLKYLTWQNPGGRWILKTPDHMLHLDALFQVYPRAKVIQTHRDPVKTTASFCSMVAHAYGIFSDRVDPLEIGVHWTNKAVTMVTRTMRERDNREDSFIDVYYPDLLEDQVRELERIYDFVGMEMTGEDRERIRQWKDDNPRYRYGKHRYSLSSFGLTEKDVDSLFAEYIETCNVPMERKTAVKVSRASG